MIWSLARYNVRTYKVTAIFGGKKGTIAVVENLTLVLCFFFFPTGPLAWKCKPSWYFRGDNWKELKRAVNPTADLWSVLPLREANQLVKAEERGKKKKKQVSGQPLDNKPLWSHGSSSSLIGDLEPYFRDYRCWRCSCHTPLPGGPTLLTVRASCVRSRGRTPLDHRLCSGAWAWLEWRLWSTGGIGWCPGRGSSSLVEPHLSQSLQ